MSPLQTKASQRPFEAGLLPHPPKRREEAWGVGVRQGQARPGQEAAGSSENQGNAAHGVEVPGAPGRLSLEVGRWAGEAGLLGPHLALLPAP